MCGIVGWYNPRKHQNELSDALHGSNLVQQLIHRGPPSQSFEEINDKRTFAMLGTCTIGYRWR